MSTNISAVEGVVLDERMLVTVTELTEVCGLSLEQVRSMVSEGMLHPRGAAPEQWRFTGIEVRRTRRALRLQRDLELNLAGAALALDLLDEVEWLRRRVRCLEHQLGALDEAEGSR
ncbi:MAG: chaperone modulator CbpM [Halochromatium sp.]|uniref:chaperone modulator CbpM n=1 Tax=Halochromatium sp. TaxID=2049430 RepID=UPI00397858BF